MNKHILKATPETYARITGGGRIDLRKAQDIFVDDEIEYQEVDLETREPTGNTYTVKVVKTSLHFPLEFNTIEELKQISVVGLIPKDIIYPITEDVDIAATLKAGANLYSVISAGEHNIDIRSARDELNNLGPGMNVAYEFVDQFKKAHKVGRQVKVVDQYDLAALYGKNLQEVLERGILVLGLAREGIEGKLE